MPNGCLLGERNLRHVLLSYMKYFNEARTHLSLNKDAPVPRAVHASGRILCRPILGGLRQGHRADQSRTAASVTIPAALCAACHLRIFADLWRECHSHRQGWRARIRSSVFWRRRCGRGIARYPAALFPPELGWPRHPTEAILFRGGLGREPPTTLHRSEPRSGRSCAGNKLTACRVGGRANV